MPADDEEGAVDPGEGAERGGISGPRWNVHHGAQAVDRKLVGGMAARFRATSDWTTRSARHGPRVGPSSSRESSAVVSPNDGFETTR